MPRRVEPEWLDVLPTDDPRAVRSRNDLRRVNRLMGTQAVIADALDTLMHGSKMHGSTMYGSNPVHLVDLGAGDGTWLLQLARSRAAHWPKVRLSLLDLHPVVHPDTIGGFRALGWDARIIGADVFDWLAQPDDDDAPVIVANLFVHHFDGERLQWLLDGIARRTRAFVCCEPRRSRLALTGSRLLGAIGCNDVTRHDAVVSVRAGFNGHELSTLWPKNDTWTLYEHSAWPFSHGFRAVRADAVAQPTQASV